MSVAILCRCALTASTTTRGMAPIVPVLKNTLSGASRNCSRILLQYCGSSGAGGAAIPRRASSGTAKAEVDADLRKLRRFVIGVCRVYSKAFVGRHFAMPPDRVEQPSGCGPEPRVAQPSGCETLLLAGPRVYTKHDPEVKN